MRRLQLLDELGEDPLGDLGLRPEHILAAHGANQAVLSRDGEAAKKRLPKQRHLAEEPTQPRFMNDRLLPLVEAVDLHVTTLEQKEHFARIGRIEDLFAGRRRDLDRSAAKRRVDTAIARGYIRNHEDRRGRPAGLVLGEPLPDNAELLPSSERLQGCTANQRVPVPSPLCPRLWESARWSCWRGVG